MDIGTGSGIIAVSLAKHLINSTLTAVDISGEALKTAEENAVLNNVETKIKFIEKDILKRQFLKKRINLTLLFLIRRIFLKKIIQNCKKRLPALNRKLL